jgi:hypothetical protein
MNTTEFIFYNLQTDKFLFQKNYDKKNYISSLLWREWDMKKLVHRDYNSDLYVEIVITDYMENFFDSLLTEGVRFLVKHCKEIVAVPIQYKNDCNSEFIVVDWIDYEKAEKILNLI